MANRLPLDPGSADPTQIRQRLQSASIEAAKQIEAEREVAIGDTAALQQVAGANIAVGRWFLDATRIVSDLAAFPGQIILDRIPRAHRIISLAVRIEEQFLIDVAGPWSLDLTLTIGAKTSVTVRIGEDPLPAPPDPPNVGGIKMQLFVAATDFTDPYNGDDLVLDLAAGGTLLAPSQIVKGAVLVHVTSSALLGNRAGLTRSPATAEGGSGGLEQMGAGGAYDL